MKTVPLYALPLQFSGDRQNAGHVWHASVKDGVEARHLRQPGEKLLRGADDCQRSGGVQRRKGRCSFQLPQHCVVNEAMLAQRRAAVYDAVTYGCGQGQASFGELVRHACNGVLRMGCFD